MKALGIITGILMIILGGYAIGVPFKTFLGIGWFLGVLFLINGIQMAIYAFSQKKKEILQGIIGILVTIGGVIILFNGVQRFLTDVMIAYLIGFYVIISGVMQICNGAKNVKADKGISILKIICGVFSIVAGIFAVGHPFMTMFSVGYLIAFSVIFQGIDIILLTVGMGKEKAE